jgi:uncharacterized protein involved in exopolysaccharide biosynthesis
MSPGVNPQQPIPAERAAETGPAEVRGYFVQVPLPRPDDRLDLRALWRHVVGHRRMIALFIVVPMALSAVAVWFMRPVYESDVVLVPAESQDAAGGLAALSSQLGGIASMVGIGAPPSSSKEQTIAILESRAFTEAFIKSENLLPILFWKQWDAEAEQWTPDWRGRVPTLADGVELFDEMIRTVSDDTSTNLVTLRIQWYDRELAARWANLLVQRLNEDVRKRDIAEAERSVEYIGRELARSDKVELRQGLYGLMQQQLERIMLANVREDYAFKVLDPAYVAEADDAVWPRKVATVAASGVLGLVLAVVAVAIRVSWRAKPGG